MDIISRNRKTLGVNPKSQRFRQKPTISVKRVLYHNEDFQRVTPTIQQARFQKWNAFQPFRGGNHEKLGVERMSSAMQTLRSSIDTIRTKNARPQTSRPRLQPKVQKDIFTEQFSPTYTWGKYRAEPLYLNEQPKTLLMTRNFDQPPPKPVDPVSNFQQSFRNSIGYPLQKVK